MKVFCLTDLSCILFVLFLTIENDFVLYLLQHFDMLGVLIVIYKKRISVVPLTVSSFLL